jgi:hypothetical protein
MDKLKNYMANSAVKLQLPVKILLPGPRATIQIEPTAVYLGCMKICR